ncbi:PREDICTED: uncharacterized protein LOC108356256 [Rhagoletis zephyria]|uniref:uncharacterized protein LOC108356256 n=1 Tax=Rhagoletis zephyria TaxID=28612 RepID=UPI00081122CD|nr:PREDICTED: uncharacterized protein LOC108356256 [Rhagoletis zephyria]
MVSQGNSAIQQLLMKFWVQGEVPTPQDNVRSPEDQKCEDYFKKTHQRHSSGRCIVRIPLKSPVTVLGESYNTAYKCLQRQLRRLQRDEQYNQLYTQFMRDYEKLGHMVKTKHDTSTIKYFMPHHGVLRPSSTTTKLRVVFNGSSPTTSGYSLNDITLTGEKIQLDITDILLWVRQHKYVFATDITKMYRQIMVHGTSSKFFGWITRTTSRHTS